MTAVVTVLSTVVVAASGAFGSPPVATPLAAGTGPQLLRAGAAEGLLRVPVGTPLGGYLRPPVGGDFLGDDPQAEATDVLAGAAEDGTPLVALPDEARVAHSPFATYSPPSRGYYDALVTKAVALDDGEDLVVLVKNDLIGMIDEVVVAVSAEVFDRTGVDVSDGLVMSATHTHDGPGAVANDAVRYFWFAMDTYHPEVFDRLVGDIASVVVDALDARVPARFGYASGQESRANSLNSFRRSRSPWTPERVALQELLRRRIGVLQIDEVDADGSPVRPLAIVMNYAAHGIVFDVENLYFSGDALAGAERSVEAAFDTPVVAMLVQSTAGDVSPRADGRPSLQRIERFGELLAPQVLSIADGITRWDAQPDLEAVSQRIVLNRDTLGYAEGEYPYEWGAVQCNADPENAPDRCIPAPPPGAADLADNGVAENDAFVPGDTRLTAVRIGEVALLAQPGEPLTEYGLRLLEASPFGADRTFIWGYSQDHVGYLLPDSREDWLLGDTEGTTTFWGWRQGARLLSATVDLMAALAGTAPAPADEFTAVYTERPYVPAVPTPSARPGRVVTEPSSITRFDTTVLRFEGGDPVVDLPTVVLERAAADGTWAPARGIGGRPIDRPFEYHLDYEVVSGAHQWTVTFEAPKDWPAGSYRFAASGVAAGAATAPYAVTSAAFDVTPAASLQLGPVTRAGDAVEAILAYTPNASGYRLIDAEVASNVAAPVREGAVTFSAGGVDVTDGAPDLETRDGVLVAVYRATLPGDVSATGVDVWGNTTP